MSSFKQRADVCCRLTPHWADSGTKRRRRYQSHGGPPKSHSLAPPDVGRGGALRPFADAADAVISVSPGDLTCRRLRHAVVRFAMSELALSDVTSGRIATICPHIEGKE